MIKTISTVAIKHVDLEAFERQVYLRAGDKAQDIEAFTALLAVLYNLSHGVDIAGYAMPTPRSCWTRLAAAIITLIVDPRLVLTDHGFDQLALYRPVLEAIFKASDFNGSDHVLGLMPPEAVEGVRKFQLFLSMDTKLKPDLTSMFKLAPQENLCWYLSMIGYAQCLSKESDDRRNELIAMWHAFEDVVVTPDQLNALVGAYMHVSYASCENKHYPKAVLHRSLHRMMAAALPLPCVKNYVPPVKSERPTIVVVLDYWSSKHAMYRCYAPSIESLKQKFKLVGVVRGAVADEEAIAMFDESIVIDDAKLVLADVAQQIWDRRPAIVYFPSIGMSTLTVAMASLRLAPIQVMSYGHPATSRSGFIDYGIIESDVGAHTECFTEEIVHIPPGSVRFVPYARFDTRHKPRVDKSGEPVRIAITAMQAKVSWPMMSALQAIEKRSNVPVRFDFYAACRGVGLAAFAKAVAEQLGNTMVYQMAEYDEFIEWLAQDDICLFGFPFGGANSVIDAMQLGLPMVSMIGKEPHSRTDATLMQRAGLPPWLVCDTVDEYVNAVVQLVQSGLLRDGIARVVRAVDLDRLCFGPDDSQAFLHAFESIYERNTLEVAA